MKTRSAALIEKILANDATGGLMFCTRREIRLVNAEPFRAAVAMARQARAAVTA